MEFLGCLESVGRYSRAMDSPGRALKVRRLAADIFQGASGAEHATSLVN